MTIRQPWWSCVVTDVERNVTPAPPRCCCHRPLLQPEMADQITSSFSGDNTGEGYVKAGGRSLRLLSIGRLCLSETNSHRWSDVPPPPPPPYNVRTQTLYYDLCRSTIAQLNVARSAISWSALQGASCSCVALLQRIKASELRRLCCNVHSPTIAEDGRTVF